MQFFTFQNIIGIIVIVISISNVTYTSKKKKQLEELTLKSRQSLKYMDKFQLITISILIFLVALSLAVSPFESSNIVFYITIGGSAISFLIAALIPLFMQQGFYKNGVVCGTSILLYNEIKIYDTSSLKNDKTITKIRFNSSGGFFSRGSYLCIDTSQLQEAKAILKKKISTKK